MLQGTAAKDDGYHQVEDEELESRDAANVLPRDGEAKCKDVFWMLLFLSGCAAMAAGLASNSKGLDAAWTSEVDSVKSELSALTATKMLGTAAGIAFFFALCWIVFVRYCVKCAVYGLFALCIAAEIFGAVALFHFAADVNGWEAWLLNGLAVCVVCLFCYTAYMLYQLRNRVNLAHSLIKVAGGVLEDCPSVFLTNAFFALLKFGWLIFAGSAAWAILANTNHDAFWVGAGLCLMTYWGLEILSNIVLVASYGTLGEWYYHSTPLVCAPLSRACTVHFGSVCFGSLLVAMIETAHDMIELCSKKGYFPEWAMCCVDKIMAGIKSGFEYINKYGFVQVAVHDESFLTASKRALSFLKYKGLTALMNDSIVATLAHVGAIAGGMLSGFIPVLLQRYYQHSEVLKVGLSGDQETALALSSFVLGSFIVYTLISPFPAFVTGLLVCFAEHPEVLAEQHTAAYEEMIRPWEAVYGQDFVDKAATRANLDVETSGVTSGLVMGAEKENPLAEELGKLCTMKSNGELSEAEFSQAKAKLLG